MGQEIMDMIPVEESKGTQQQHSDINIQKNDTGIKTMLNPDSSPRNKILIVDDNVFCMIGTVKLL